MFSWSGSQVIVGTKTDNRFGHDHKLTGHRQTSEPIKIESKIIQKARKHIFKTVILCSKL